MIPVFFFQRPGQQFIMLLPAVKDSSAVAAADLSTALPCIFVPPPGPAGAHSKPLGELLVAMGRLTRERLAEVERARRPAGQKLGRYLLRRKYITAADLCAALAVKHNLPVADLGRSSANRNLAARFSFLMLMRLRAVPFAIVKDNLYVAATEPLTAAATRELEKRTGLTVRLFLAPDDAVAAHLYELQPAGERRFRVRTRCDAVWPVTVQPGDKPQNEDQGVAGTTVNLSENDLLVASQLSLRRKDLARLTVELPTGAIRGLYVVRHVTRVQRLSGSAFPWRLGLECLEMANEDGEKLRVACSQYPG